MRKIVSKITTAGLILGLGIQAGYGMETSETKIQKRVPSMVEKEQIELQNPVFQANLVVPEVENRLILKPTDSIYQLIDEFLMKQQIEKFLTINRIANQITNLMVPLRASTTVSPRNEELQEQPMGSFRPIQENLRESIQDLSKRFCAQVKKFKGNSYYERDVIGWFGLINREERYEVANYVLRCFELNPQLINTSVIEAFGKVKNREDFLNFITEKQVKDVRKLVKMAKYSTRSSWESILNPPPKLQPSAAEIEKRRLEAEAERSAFEERYKANEIERLKRRHLSWEITYKKKFFGYITSVLHEPKLYEFKEPNEYWTLSNSQSVSKKLDKITCDFINEKVDIHNYDSWGNYGYRETLMKRLPSIVFSLHSTRFEQNENWIETIISSLKQLDINVFKTSKHQTDLDSPNFEIQFPCVDMLKRLLNFFIETDDLPQKKATEFLEAIGQQF